MIDEHSGYGPPLPGAYRTEGMLADVPVPKPPPLHRNIEVVCLLWCPWRFVLGTVRPIDSQGMAWEGSAVLHHGHTCANPQPIPNANVKIANGSRYPLVLFMVVSSINNANMLVTPVRALALKPLLKDLKDRH